jgi:hypothetical protein
MSRSTPSSIGWVELEVTLIEGVEWGGEEFVASFTI